MLHRKRRFADDGLAHPHSEALNPSDRLYLRSQRIGAEAIGAQATGTKAIGTLAVGAIAIGALAIGALAIGYLTIGRARVRRLEIDELVVRKLRIIDELELSEKSRGASTPRAGRTDTNR